jgi:hypothetical protein
MSLGFGPAATRPPDSLGYVASRRHERSPEQKKDGMSEESGSVATKPDGDALYYTPAEWEAFILGVKDGEFDDMVEDAPSPSEPAS